MNSGVSTLSQATAQAPDRLALSAIVAPRDYVARVNEVIERIGPACDQATVLGLLRTCTSALGAENAAFVSFVRDNADVSACRFMLACAPGWCQRYLDDNCIVHDPWLAYAAHHGEPIVASTLHAFDLEARRVIDLASQNGFASAALVPVHSGTGHSRISLLCLGSSQAGFFEGDGFGRFRLGARLLAAELHDWWMARIRRELIVKARITPSDLELLRHEFHGHSSKRIAAALQVSTSSINSRFQRMNSKLGVPNSRTAARLVAECGLLD
jgi:DNA-binding CsgD family transcriptional regulator